MPIRSGRFSVESFSDPFVIITGKAGVFRIYNSGDDPFVVNGSLTLNKECSVDIEVSKEGGCTISGGAGKHLEGSYDFVGGHDRIRNGRFKNSGTIINTGTAKLSYRILNSGAHDITVSVAGGTPVTLKPRFSIDVTAKGLVEVSGADIEGIYALLDSEREIKSGRFKISINRDNNQQPIANPEYPHKIIDLANSGSDLAWYRLFNSGETPIIIQENNGASAKKLGVVASKNSLDFAVTNQPIFVRPDDDGDGEITPASDNVGAIEGSYDYLGAGG